MERKGKDGGYKERHAFSPISSSRGTTESLLDDKSFIQEEKVNVIQRVYDMYDDEYDDTYDGINEAPGTVGMDDEDDSAVDKVKGSKKKQPTAEDPGVAFESTPCGALVAPL